jgi:ABC-type taurine transport system ATPase subunit
MDRLIPWLSIACSAFDLELEEGFSLEAANGTIIRASARIKGPGQELGILVFQDCENILKYSDFISESGFGCPSSEHLALMGE